ncbi:hypothetical protein PR202_gb28638 [Eleusine coracana subsp. coracana]|uniref:Uncharacterized protein n=1 Tax=Eleusine coracana subsp. coracana TaxID=191504 RepID=A0AAV5FXH3_ELECO|nr:hypothetical protein PR202_gb28638 [Eleusine coracana subsp. coracana]
MGRQHENSTLRKQRLMEGHSRGRRSCPMDGMDSISPEFATVSSMAPAPTQMTQQSVAGSPMRQNDAAPLPQCERTPPATLTQAEMDTPQEGMTFTHCRVEAHSSWEFVEQLGRVYTRSVFEQLQGAVNAATSIPNVNLTKPIIPEEIAEEVVDDSGVQDTNEVMVESMTARGRAMINRAPPPKAKPKG